jgi:PGAP1-like protein
VKVTVRSDALFATAGRVSELAEEVGEEAARLAGALAAAGPPSARGDAGGAALVALWVRLEVEAVGVVGPGGAWGEALALDVLASALRGAARVYVEIEQAVVGVLGAVAAGADLAARGGWLRDSRPAGGPMAPGGADGVRAAEPGDPGLGGGATVEGVTVRAVDPTLHGPLAGDALVPGRARHLADLVAAGEDLDGGRVRVLETAGPDGGAAWVVVVPGTQQWSPRAGANPFDLTTDVRALTGEATLAAAGVTAALDLARSRSGRAGPDDPVLLVGHSQGGILAAALASDPAFRREHRVTHIVTSGSPVALFPVPASTRVLSVEHGDDPVPWLDLTPNPAGASWLTVRAPAAGPVDVSRHGLAGYVETLRTLEGAPRGTVSGLDAWQASAGAFLGAPVRSVSEVVVERGWQNPRS